MAHLMSAHLEINGLGRNLDECEADGLRQAEQFFGERKFKMEMFGADVKGCQDGSRGDLFCVQWMAAEDKAAINRAVPPRLPAKELTISFVMPAKLLNMNDREHWGPRHLRTAEWRKAAYIYARDQFGPYPLKLGKSIVLVSLPVSSLKRRHDPSNYFPTVKAIVDGMVDAGVWADDDSSHVATTEPTLTLGGLVVVTITPWSAP